MRALWLSSGKLVSGIQLVLKVLRFEEQVQGADLVFTGEGSSMPNAFGSPCGSWPHLPGLRVPVVVLAGTCHLRFRRTAWRRDHRKLFCFEPTTVSRRGHGPDCGISGVSSGPGDAACGCTDSKRGVTMTGAWLLVLLLGAIVFIGDDGPGAAPSIPGPALDHAWRGF